MLKVLSSEFHSFFVGIEDGIISRFPDLKLSPTNHVQPDEFLLPYGQLHDSAERDEVKSICTRRSEILQVQK